MSLFLSRPTKKCKQCGNPFEPQRALAVVCSPVCAGKYAKGLGKQRKAERLSEAKQVRQRREALKTIPDLIKEAQREFNAYIRQRAAENLASAVGNPWARGLLVELTTQGTTDPRVVLLISALMNEIATLKERFATDTGPGAQWTIGSDWLPALDLTKSSR